jgi:hypothetical protein
MPVAEPHKELRFTRAAQALPFWLLGAVSAITAITLFTVGRYREENPDLPSSSWAILPAIACWGSLRLAVHCTRHAYLILSPLGVEIFPFFRPASGMQIIHWSEIDSIDHDDRRLTLHFDPQKRAGVHLTLTPIPPSRRPLLIQALSGRLSGTGPDRGD